MKTNTEEKATVTNIGMYNLLRIAGWGGHEGQKETLMCPAILCYSTYLMLFIENCIDTDGSLTTQVAQQHLKNIF